MVNVKFQSAECFIMVMKVGLFFVVSAMLCTAIQKSNG